MTTIEAIETEYAGCRFRSRLEARWAVFFDALHVKWEYEPQGYLLGVERRPYLPDFWLPGLGIWVEVKGETSALDIRLLDLAVSHPGGLPSDDPYGELGILILGPIPKPGTTALHWRMFRTLYAPGENFCACWDLRYSQHAFESYPAAALELVRRETGEPFLESPGATLLQIGRTYLRPLHDDIVQSQPDRRLLSDPRVDAAYRAARSARFEHGETPKAA